MIANYFCKGTEKGFSLRQCLQNVHPWSMLDWTLVKHGAETLGDITSAPVGANSFTVALHFILIALLDFRLNLNKLMLTISLKNLEF